jgi:hypothetical protein
MVSSLLDRRKVEPCIEITDKTFRTVIMQLTGTIPIGIARLRILRK